MKIYQSIVLVILLFLAGLVLQVMQIPFYLNLSDSEPWGIYRLTKFTGHLDKGELIIMKVPAQARPYVYGRGWLPNGGLLLKNVGALPGDLVSITNDRIMINQKDTGPVFQQDQPGKAFTEAPGFVPNSTRLFLYHWPRRFRIRSTAGILARSRYG